VVDITDQMDHHILVKGGTCRLQMTSWCVL